MLGDSVAQCHLHRASYHAVARFVERILGVRIEIDAATLGAPLPKRNRLIAQAYCDAVGKTIDQIRAQILTEPVLAACLAGISHVGTDLFCAKIDQPNGVVVTAAWPSGTKTRPRRCGPPTKAESRRTCRRAEITGKHRRKTVRDPS